MTQPSTAPATSKDPPAGADQAFLDQFFDEAVRAVQEGGEVSFASLGRGREHLMVQAARLADLAHAVADCGSAGPPPSFGGYRIIAELGRGGMAAVYLACQDRMGGRLVALKVLPPHISHSPTARARFKAEVMALANQRHHGVVRAFDVIEDGPSLAYTMEWVDGRSLQQVIDHLCDLAVDGAAEAMDRVRELLGTPAGMMLDPAYSAFVARVGAAVARALQSVHESGIVHRDIKPSNILIRRDGTALVTDFGLALGAGGHQFTVTSAFMGTASYAPPEQLRGAWSDLDARSDVYSLGATLYHALALRPPYPGTNPAEILGRIATGTASPADRGRRGVPEELSRIVSKAIEPEPARRFESAGAMAEELERFVRREPVATRAAGWPRRLSEWARRRRGVLALTAGGVGLALVAAGVTMWATRPGERRASAPTQTPQLGPGWRIEDPDGVAGDQFGSSVAGWGERLAVGAPKATVGGLGSAGTASIFRRSGEVWVKEAGLAPPDPRVGASFGSSVALGGDVAVVGAENANADEFSRAGAAYVYRREGTRWRYTQRLSSGIPGQDLGFGHCASLCGDILFVGVLWGGDESTGFSPGVGTIFRVSPDGAATQLQHVRIKRLRVSGTMALSCSVQCGGDMIVLGFGYGVTPAGDSAGSLFVLVRTDRAADRWELVQSIIPEDIHPHANLGWAVTAWCPPGKAESPGNMVIAASATALNAGLFREAGGVRIYEPARAGALEWTSSTELLNSSPAYFEHLGQSLAWAGDRLVTSDQSGPAGGNQGSLVMFSRSAGDGRWSPSVRIHPSPGAGDEFGRAMSAWADGQDRYLAAGARLVDGTAADPSAGADRGAVWVWRLGGAQ